MKHAGGWAKQQGKTQVVRGLTSDLTPGVIATLSGLMGLTACLYPYDIGPAIQENRPPVVSNCVPTDEEVLVTDLGILFEVAYTDPDLEDLGSLELSWNLAGFDWGTGDRLPLTPYDVAPYEQPGQQGVPLIATVTDPEGEDDDCVWYLRTTGFVQGE